MFTLRRLVDVGWAGRGLVWFPCEGLSGYGLWEPVGALDMWVLVCAWLLRGFRSMTGDLVWLRVVAHGVSRCRVRGWESSIGVGKFCLPVIGPCSARWRLEF